MRTHKCRISYGVDLESPSLIAGPRFTLIQFAISYQHFSLWTFKVHHIAIIYATLILDKNLQFPTSTFRYGEVFRCGIASFGHGCIVVVRGYISLITSRTAIIGTGCKAKIGAAIKHVKIYARIAGQHGSNEGGTYVVTAFKPAARIFMSTFIKYRKSQLIKVRNVRNINSSSSSSHSSSHSSSSSSSSYSISSEST
uniref:Uncharacterized protein n=1 Tax=Glossina palpalis gambiensis TaxID=67801 RepID=A0A1B0BT72_9MUSC